MSMLAQISALRQLLWSLHDAGVQVRATDISTWALDMNMRHTERDANGYALWEGHS